MQELSDMVKTKLFQLQYPWLNCELNGNAIVTVQHIGNTLFKSKSMNILQCANYVMNIGKDMSGEPKSDCSLIALEFGNT